MSVYGIDAAINSGNLIQNEIDLYGSSRLGLFEINRDVHSISTPALNNIYTFERRHKFFELSNHLGNVLATISDKKLPILSGSTVMAYNADVITAQDYYPGGMMMPGRKYAASSSKYRYGFNGKENDNDVKGEGNQQDYGMRIYDPRLGRFLSSDPLTKQYPYYTPYQFAGNTPLIAIDLDGLEPKVVITNEETGYTKLNVYGDGNVRAAVVATYKAVVQYVDSKGQVATLGQFNVTRDGWYDMGTDEKGNTILYNRSSDQADTKKNIHWANI